MVSQYRGVLVAVCSLAFTAAPVPVVAEAPAAAPAAQAASGMPEGMKQYWFVMLSKGPRRGEAITPERAAGLQAGHMAHMAAEHEAGRLVMAGPFGDDGDWRGIQIYDAGSREEVEAICARDPAVEAGRLACEVRPWWGQVGTTLK
ncbi:YciI family protein [Pseudofulvimonas gallinarii]|jgi:uncharacterized protein YciI|uniref:Uncharacterized protein YciI n=1 Tax=Pseudofulvimonas gallinarii TaxID=634155 RepID=A0A4R3LBN6_9GAMM|nr:YciI family protein [Pseudofulvimonas gallinarii]TCS97209.1 uncharacterized protein YciI [Pseudofulvimonas gallinarii]THD12518.1 hypothetical protein B1808_12335 [Pseudofulvimonas gallinarii]